MAAIYREQNNAEKDLVYDSMNDKKGTSICFECIWMNNKNCISFPYTGRVYNDIDFVLVKMIFE